MSLDKLLERIKKDAQSKAKEIENRAQKEADAAVLSVRNAANDEKESYLQNEEKRIKVEKEAVLAKARLDARDIILKSKRNMLNKVREEVLTKVSEMSGPEYENMLLKLLLNNCEGSEEVVMANSLADKIVDEANKKLSELGKTAQLKASEEKIMDNGLILIDEIGTRTDLTLKSVIDYHIQELEPEVFNILAGKVTK